MNKERWSRYLKVYDPLKAGSIDGTDDRPHDKGIERAIESVYVPNKDLDSDPTKTLFVGRLSPETTEEGLYKVFSKFGVIKSLYLIRDIVTGFSKRYAFVEFEMHTDAEEACDRMNSEYIDNHTVFVDWECGRTLPKWIPRRLGGGFSGRKESGQLRFGGKDRPFKRPFIIGERQNSPGGQQDDERRRRGDSLGRDGDRMGYREERGSRGESYRGHRERFRDRRDSEERVRVKQEPGRDGYGDTRSLVRLKQERDGEWYEDSRRRRSPVRIKQEDPDRHRDRRRSRSRERDRRARSRSMERRRSRDRSRDRRRRDRSSERSRDNEDRRNRHIKREETGEEESRSEGREKRRFTEVKTEDNP